VFRDEIATPLGVDFYIGTPESVPDDRIAPLVPPSRFRMMTGLPLPVVLSSMSRHSILYRSLIANPGTTFYVDPHHVIVRNLEVPSGGGVGSARGIARAYGVFASGGHELALRGDTLAALAAPAQPSRRGFHDECFGGPVEFSLGFMKPCKAFPFGHEGAYGAPGAGGSMGYADPRVGIGYGYVTNRMGIYLSGDPRDVALRRAIPESALRTTAVPPLAEHATVV
jgi:CubicO group peptidase (beta-lactamase class C family)